ncbi:MAG: signal recognition particle-docking protein FtsY [Flavobacteriaceae bacterium]|jgi:fused signal recognition particle receptor|nr:signal recognition particle-docking protein FtsY [Flavobacteriaceae bacterium]|tara:strand:+ start:6484 stop:7419 length:936 start_codon:yes stop_codon:yes gene_type:complete
MGLFSKSTKKLQSGLSATKKALTERLKKVVLGKSRVDADFLEELEEILITSDVGVATTEKIINRLEKRVAKDKFIKAEGLDQLLYEEILNLFTENNSKQVTAQDGLQVILVVGVNGAGKTTTVGKLAHQYSQQGKKVMLAAADTFRAGAVDQLRLWSEMVEVPFVSLQEGSDPASVAFTAVERAKKEQVDLLFIDTAGRLHNNTNLMHELSKIERVVKKIIPEAPHQTLLVLDGGTGQNAYMQAKLFTEATAISGLILTKLDGTAKGGVVIGISDELDVPIHYIGVGEGKDDLIKFETKAFLDLLFQKTSL